jgi:hypothetical protein
MVREESSVGERVSVEELRRRATEFFARVVDLLVERNRVRGDSYLEMSAGEIAAMFRDKGGRILTASRQDTSDWGVRRELIDACLDEAGYGALMSIWLEEILHVTDEEWQRVARKSDSGGD